ncbi:hypothetical protein ACYSNW_15205 [Enterococcus sp. LJL99]
MENRVNALTFGQLKKIISDLERDSGITNETKVFIDTGWDSVQEVEPNAFCVEKVMEFKVQDEWTKETYFGFSLIEKAERMKADGEPETAIIIRNLY